MQTKAVFVDGVQIGGGAVPVIQSMTTVRPSDVDSSIAQISELAAAGCEIVRVAVLDKDDALAVRTLKNNTDVPLVADIHFDAELARMAMESGADKIRINPGNFPSAHLESIAQTAKAARIPIRIGVNSGSLPKDMEQKFGNTAVALCEAALEYIRRLEALDFDNLVVSIKSSNVLDMIEGYRLLAGKTHYPLHLGVTEAGLVRDGLIKSSVGIGALLLDGIGDTIRFSLSTSPVEEVYAARRLLVALGLAEGHNLICCPTCGRCEYDLFALAEEVERVLLGYKKPLTVAIMGCAVNGPGEAKHADIGIAGSKNQQGVLFKKGTVVASGGIDSLKEMLVKEIAKLRKD